MSELKEGMTYEEIIIALTDDTDDTDDADDDSDDDSDD